MERKTDTARKTLESALADVYEQGVKRAKELGPVHFSSEAEEARKAGYDADHPMHWAFRNGFAYGSRKA